MNVPLRTSFMRTITPQAASPNGSLAPLITTGNRKRRNSQEDQEKRDADPTRLVMAKCLDPEEGAADEGLVAPGCGRSVCRNCSCENSLT
jgi:hypothetical protein